MELSDINGAKIRVGAKAVILKHADGLAGKIGEVRGIAERCAALRNKPGIRVADGPDDMPHWSLWTKPENVAVLP